MAGKTIGLKINHIFAKTYFSKERIIVEINNCLNEIEYYRNYNSGAAFDSKIKSLRTTLAHKQDYLAELKYEKDVYIPKYNKLIEPLKSLDHFYITV